MNQVLEVNTRPARSDSAAYLSHDEAMLREFAMSAVEEAVRLGASTASVDVAERGGITMEYRDGRTENAVRSGSQSLIVRTFLEGRTGVATSGALSRDTIRGTVERAIAIAKLVEIDEDAAPADSKWLDSMDRAIPLFAPSGMSAAELAEAAGVIGSAVAARVAGDPRLRLLGTAASSRDHRWARAIGPDFCRSGSASLQMRSCSVIAEHEGRMVANHWASTDRRTEHLDPPDVIAARAIERVLRQTGARGMTTRACPVLFDSTIAASLIDGLTGALTGRAQDQKATFLPDALGRRVLAPHLDLVEDPFEPYGLASGASDSEGVAAMQRHVVRDGVVEGYFLSSRSARRLGLPPTGNADGCWNLRLSSRLTDAGDDLAAMLRRLDRGLWVTDIMGGGLNPVTGAYSQAVTGLWVEDGVVQYPVEDITVAASLPVLLADIRHVGADVHRSPGTRSGSILIDAMQVAGR